MNYSSRGGRELQRRGDADENCTPYHQAEALLNGTVLLTGGSNIDDPNDFTAELYTPPVPPGISASPATYAFPDTVETRTSPPQIFTISNLGSTTLTLNSIDITGSDFTIGVGDLCPAESEPCRRGELHGQRYLHSCSVRG